MLPAHIPSRHSGELGISQIYGEIADSCSDFHIAHGAEGSIMVTKVAEPSAYGVVVTKPGSTVIDRFVEKPVEFVGNRINAGIYMFNPSILNRIEVS
jgi:NDP-sugar pyrophosphorylase family protein